MAVQAGQVQVGLQLSTSQFTKGMQQATQSVNNFVSHVGSAGKQTSLFGSAATKAGVAVGALGFTLAKFAKQSFGVAADVNEMNVAMEAVGFSTGIGGKAIKDAANKVRSMGIEMKASQEIAMLFVKSNINLAQAHEMARVAQDLAVISQSNSTETARTLVYAIQTGNSMLLKSAGITKYASEAYSQYARELKKGVSGLTASERQQAVLNMVLSEGKKVAGVYEAAMQEAGKVLRSFPRIINDIQLEFGRLFVDGFGPVILSAYKVTSEFSKMLREGGSLHPVMQALKEVFNQMVAPLKGVFDSITLGLKKINAMEFSTEKLRDTIQKLLPATLALGTALSMLAARNVLMSLGRLFPMLSPLAGIIGAGGPLIAGLVVMAALTPEIRDSFMGLVDAVKPLAGSIAEFATGLAPVFLQLIETSTELATTLSDSLVGGVGMFSTALQSVAAIALPLIGTLASFVGYLSQFQGALQVIVALIAAKWLYGLISINTQLGLSGSLVTSLGAKMGVTGKIFNFQFVNMRMQGVGTFAAIATSSKVAFGSMAVAARTAGVAMMTALAPMIAITAAVYAAIKIFEAFSNKNKEVKEATKAVSDELNEQLKAFGGASDAIAEYLTSAGLLSNALLGAGENGDKLAIATSALGISAEDTATTLAAMKDAQSQNYNAVITHNKALLEASGLETNYAEAIARSAHATDQMYGRATILAAVRNSAKDQTIELTESEYLAFEALQQLGKQAKDTDFATFRKSISDATIKSSKYGGAAVKAANAIMDSEIKTKDFANELDKTNRFADILAEELLKIEKASKKAGDALPTIKVETSAAAIFGLNKTLMESELTLDMAKKAMFQNSHAALDMAEKMYGLNKSFGGVLTQVKAAKGDFGKLKDAGYGLVNQIGENINEITRLGGSTKDSAIMMESLIEQFTTSAKAAGFNDEKVKELLTSLGVLDAVKNLKLTIEIEATRAKEELGRLQKQVGFLLMMGKALNDPNVVKALDGIKALNHEIDMMNQVVISVDGAFKGLSNQQKGNTGKTATLKQATEMLTKKIKDQKRAVVEARQALQDYARSSAEAVVQAVSVGTVFSRFQASQARKAEIAAQKEADNVALQRENARKLIDSKNELIDAENQLIQLQNEFASSVGGSVLAVLSFSGVISQQENAVSEYNQALLQQTQLQGKASEAQAEYGIASAEVLAIQQKLSTTTGRYAKRVLGEELVKAQGRAQSALEKLTEVEAELTSATEEANKAQQKQITFLQGLEQQATRALKFGSIIEQLSQAGLSQDALRQIVDAGAEAGTKMGEELLAGGIESIGKANEFSKQIIDEGKRVTGLFSKTLKERLEYEIYQDKRDYGTLGEEVGETFTESLAKQHTKAKEFTDKVKQLISMGLRGKQLEEVLNAGVDSGTEIADALIASGADTIQQSVAIQDELKELSKKFGDELVPYFDQTGVLLAQALLKALQKELKDLPNTLKGKSGKEIFEFIEDFDNNFADKARGITDALVGTPPDVAPVVPSGRRTEAEIKSVASGYSSFKEAVKALHPVAVEKFTSDGTGLNASEMAKLKAQFPRLAATPFAMGGIVTKPTLGLVGEAGAEAVIPLSKLGDLGGSSYNITVNAGMGANGVQVGAQIVEAIKKYEKSNGTRWRS